jgi:hypothetical protein
VHGLVRKEPASLVVQETVPVGVFVPLLAVTVATQVRLLPRTTVGIPVPQVTLVLLESTDW